MNADTLRRLGRAYTAELPAAVAATYPTALFSAGLLIGTWLISVGAR